MAKKVDLLLAADLFRAGIEYFYKAIQQMVTQKLSTKTTKKFFFK